MTESTRLQYALTDHPGWMVTVSGIHRDRRKQTVAEVSVANGAMHHVGPVILGEPATWAEWLAAAASSNGPGSDDLHALLLHRVYPDALEALAEGTGGGTPSTAADRLVALISPDQLFHDDMTAYAKLTVKGGSADVLALRESRFETWLSREAHRTLGTVPSQDAIAAAINTLEGMARFDGSEERVWTRVAEHEGDLYLDLANSAQQVIRISPSGWDLVDHAPVLFCRWRAMRALPMPERGGAISDVFPFLNAHTDAGRALLLAWVVAAFRPTGPYPILILHGEHGSAKTTTARVLRALVDPNRAPMRAMPGKEHDLLIAATHAHVVALDNLSGLKSWASDALCRLSTGGFSVRGLYTDTDEVIFEGLRPAILTGIDDLATRADLLDRALMIDLPAIPEDQRRLERELWERFAVASPRLLGALLDVIATGLQHLPTTQLDTLPRMADFAQWAIATEHGMPWPPGTFARAYAGNRGEANTLALDAMSITAPLLALLEHQSGWTGTPTALLDELTRRADAATVSAPGWPKRANSLSKDINRIAPNLRTIGFDVRQERRNNARYWIIQRTRDDAEDRRDRHDRHNGVLTSRAEDSVSSRPLGIPSPTLPIVTPLTRQHPERDDCDDGDDLLQRERAARDHDDLEEAKAAGWVR